MTALKTILEEKALDGFIVTNPTNIFYLTGFKGFSPTERETILVLRPKYSAVLIVPRLYQKEMLSLKKISPRLQIKVVKERNELFETAKKLISPFSQARLETNRQAGLDDEYKIGFEENDLKYGEYQELSLGSDPGKGPTLKPHADLIENLRMFKTTDEIAKIEKAQIISQKAFEHIVKTLKIGQSEEEIADTLAKIIKSLGTEGVAFESIVASGKNAGLPHHKTSKKRIKNGEVLLFDFGAKYQNYMGDLSRTVFLGRARDEHKNIYMHVKLAQKKALGKISHNIKASDAYHAVNNHFKKHNLEKYFIHGLGHGIGLEIHERPYLRTLTSQTGFEDQALTDNMVFSVEPGLYFPWGGVRIEDLVTIAGGSTKVLGKMVDEPIELDI